MSELGNSLERLWRRLLCVVGRALITAVSDDGSVQTVQVQLSAMDVRDSTPRLAEFGLASVPPIGSNAMVLFIGGDRSNGVVVATGHQASRPRNLKPGETMLYSVDGKSVYLSDNGIVIDAKGEAVTVNNAASLTVNSTGDVILNTPHLKVSGDIIDNFGTNVHSMAQMRSIYDSHTHGGVQPGAGNTSGPSASM